MQELPPNSQEILNLLRFEGVLTTKELEEKTNKSQPYILKRTKSLRDHGLINWTGHTATDPRGGWELAE